MEISPIARGEDVHCRDLPGALSETSANAISDSIIRNSARWRLMFEFSAHMVRAQVPNFGGRPAVCSGMACSSV